MNFKRFSIALSGFLVMGLPAVAGAYYYARTAPHLDAMAKAEQSLPPRCKRLEEELHMALMHNYPHDTIETTRKDREQGVRLCANGAEQEGVLALRTALQDLGIKSEI